MKRKLVIYTDGSAHHETRHGGYGVVIIEGDKETELSGGYNGVTNNQMELYGAIAALQHLYIKDYAVEDYQIAVYSDSQYVVNGFNVWSKSWELKEWKNVKNAKLWKNLKALAEGLNINFHWVRGHNGNKYNERCDVLAGIAYRQQGAKAQQKEQIET